MSLSGLFIFSVLMLGTCEFYHYPVGSTLRRSIKDNGNHDLLRVVISDVQIQGFLELFKKDPLPSIDNFLSTHTEFEAEGKAAIAAVLPCASNLPTGGWYELLYNGLVSGAASPQEPLRIITFNYDLSLEHYLRETFQWHFKISPEKASERLLEFVEIVHIYGTIGVSSVNVHQLLRDGGHEEVKRLMEQAAAGIKVLNNRDPSSTEVSLAKKMQLEREIAPPAGENVLYAPHIRSAC
jgi:hypothetical protein